MGLVTLWLLGHLALITGSHFGDKYIIAFSYPFDNIVVSYGLQSKNNILCIGYFFNNSPNLILPYNLPYSF